MPTNVQNFEHSPAIYDQAGFGTLKADVQGLFLDFRSSLAMVEHRIEDRLVAQAESLVDVSTYLHALGGKRIRPLLALACGKLFGLKSPSKELIDVAAGIELIHMATLLHDDIIDQTPIRRHKPSALQVFGMPATLLSGDFLLVRAFGLCAQLGEFIISATEQACVELTEGEILEGHLKDGQSVGLDHYTNVIDKKTASLFWLSAIVGAHLGGADQHNIECAARFGRYAGIAFQMVDDILDIVADQDLLGKPVGTDLKQQTPSLVNILWFQSGDKTAKEFFSKTSPSQAECEAAAAYLRESEIIHSAREHALSYVEKSKSELSRLSASTVNDKVRSQLTTLVEYTYDRCF